jgi:hypothetical protein
LLRVSYLEIYNEVITDLLNPKNKDLRIRENIYVCAVLDIFAAPIELEVMAEMQYECRMIQSEADFDAVPSPSVGCMWRDSAKKLSAVLRKCFRSWTSVKV